MSVSDGIFRRIFGGKKVAQIHESEIKAVEVMVRRLVDIINESLHLANDSTNPDTKISRLALAKEKLEDVEELTRQHPYIVLEQLDDVRNTIVQIENDFLISGVRVAAEGNEAGSSLEKAGNVIGAISEYETLLEKGVDTPFTYRRLAILYRKRKMRSDEIRAIKEALKNVPRSNAKHYGWFVDRLAKLAK